MCMDESGDADLKAASLKLETLRTIRNDADYDLGTAKFSKPMLVQLQLSYAKDIEKTVKAAEARKKTFCPKVTKYARETLKLR